MLLFVLHNTHNPSGRTVAVGSPQPLNTNDYQKYLLGKRRPVSSVDNITTFMCQLSRNLETDLPRTLWA